MLLEEARLGSTLIIMIRKLGGTEPRGSFGSRKYLSRGSQFRWLDWSCYNLGAFGGPNDFASRYQIRGVHAAVSGRWSLIRRTVPLLLSSVTSVNIYWSFINCS